MIVANKFQTGLDLPQTLCQGYVDKKLGGSEAANLIAFESYLPLVKVDTGTFVLDFFNDPDDILVGLFSLLSNRRTGRCF